LTSEKPTNPKDAIGVTKAPIHLWPNTATLYGALAFLTGALKYGRSNWRVAGVRASVYIDAAKRHLDSWFEGEDLDDETKISHLGHALACIAIIVDAKEAGKLNDDRQVKGGYLALLKSTPDEVVRLKALYADRNPKHYTIADNEQ